MDKDKYFLGELPEIEQRDENGVKTDYIVGYAARFDSWSNPMQFWGKPFVEKIDKRAFDEVDFSKVVASRNHDFNILGRTDKGTLAVKIDTVGLRYELKVPNTTNGKDTLEDVRNGNLAGSSFVFSLKEDNWTFKEDKNTPDERTILKFDKIFELGPVGMPAYPDSTAKAAKRSYDEAKKAIEQREDTEFKDRVKRLVRKYNYLKAKRKK